MASVITPRIIKNDDADVQSIQWNWQFKKPRLEGAMAVWDGKFVLRRVEETDLRFHRVYKVSKRSDGITDADNVFDGEPRLVSKAMYAAFSVGPPRTWDVKLAGVDGTVRMGVFQLRSV
jgi:hypothetical protein